MGTEMEYHGVCHKDNQSECCLGGYIEGYIGGMGIVQRGMQETANENAPRVCRTGMELEWQEVCYRVNQSECSKGHRSALMEVQN